MSTFSSANVTDGNLLLKERTHTINNKIELHILGVPPNKLGSWLIGRSPRSKGNSPACSVAYKAKPAEFSIVVVAFLVARTEWYRL